MCPAKRLLRRLENGRPGSRRVVNVEMLAHVYCRRPEYAAKAGRTAACIIIGGSVVAQENGTRRQRLVGIKRHYRASLEADRRPSM